MDGNLELIVDVQVSRDVQPFNSVDFNAVLFITDEQVFSERVRQYSRKEDLLTDGFSTESAAYKAVRSYFSQTPRPTQIAVGRRDATIAVLSMVVGDVVNSGVYSLTIAGTTVSYTAAANAEDDAAAEIALIINGLETLALAESSITTVITPLASGLAASTILTLTEITSTTLAFDSSQFTASYTQETWAAAIAAVSGEYDSWYLLETYDHSVAGALAIAAEIEAMEKLYLVSQSHADNKGVQAIPAGANDLAGQLEELNLDRTAFCYSGSADSTFLEAGLAGKKMTTVAGGTTWDLAAVAGVVADKITRTEITNLEAKNANYFTTYGGKDYVRQGKVVSGEWIDTMRGADNLKSDIQRELARVMASANNSGSKIPLTDVGVAILMDSVAGIMEQYVTRGYIKDTISVTDGSGNVRALRGYSITAQSVDSLTTSQRASRQAPDIQVIAYLASAVHKAKVYVNLFV
jgi:hypothetical protein